MVKISKERQVVNVLRKMETSEEGGRRLPTESTKGDRLGRVAPQARSRGGVESMNERGVALRASPC